jgi:hypothetical protein
MNPIVSPQRNATLPWLAAAVAAGMVVVQQGASMAFWLLSSGKSPDFDGDLLAQLLAPLYSRLVLTAGVSFLVVQWHGERRRALYFAQPWIVLSIFAGGLLLSGLLAILLYQFGLRQLIAPQDAPWLSLTLLEAIGLAFDVLGIWLSWWIAARLQQHRALPMPAQGDQRLRAAGLAAVLLYAVLLSLVPVLGRAGFMLTPSPLQQWLGVHAGMLLPALFAFIGVLTGLPRRLAAVHAARLLAASATALFCSLLLTAGIGFAALLIILGSAYGSNSDAIFLAVLAALGLLLLVGTPGLYWLWIRLFYRKLRVAVPALAGRGDRA